MNNNSLEFFFGHSHNINFIISSSFPYSINKSTLLFLSLNKEILNYFLYKLINIRPYSIYTLRGLRFRNQILFKKIGKVNTL